MTAPHPEGTVLVLAPFGRDAQSIVDLIARAGLAAEAMSSADHLVDRLGDDTGLVVLTEEAIPRNHWNRLRDAVTAQPSWSSYPFIMMAGQRRPGRSGTGHSVLPAEVTNVMVLERPMGGNTLMSAVQWALSGRRRQFITRDHLEELSKGAEQQRLMTRELAHRVKNTIAVLQSIVGQTMRPYSEMASVTEIIVERFAALSRAHDLLLGEDFVNADFRELVERTLLVHEGAFDLAGPPLRLSPQASLSFALVLHELATNSIKYGALKSPTGIVTIRWQVTPTSPREFAFTWTERGGPPSSSPGAEGFGSRLIRATLSGFGHVETHYPREGFDLSFSGDLDSLVFSATPEFA